MADARAQAAPSLRVCALSLGAALLLALLAPAEERTDVARARAHALQTTVASPLYAVRCARASRSSCCSWAARARCSSSSCLAACARLDCPPPGGRPGLATASGVGELAGASYDQWSG